MKTFKYLAVLIAFVCLLLIGCSDKSQLPVEPTDQNSSLSLNKKGPVVHSVGGSGLLTADGKNCGARYAAHEYADGTFDGDYEVNSANASGDPTFKINGNVISFKVYENAGPYGGKMAVFLGREKTEVFAGWYDVFFAIDNGKPGQTSDPDQVNWWLIELPSLDAQVPAWWGTAMTGMTIEEIFAMSPDDLISNLGIADCDKGNIVVK